MLRKIIQRIKNKQPRVYRTLKKIQAGKFWFRRLLRPVWFYLISKQVKPLSQNFGFDRGGSIDRYYIEKFLESNKSDIKGKVLEILNDNYTKKFDSGVTKNDILDIDTSNKKANIHGDLRKLDKILDNSYDCVILTQVLQFIDNYQLAIAEIKRVLKPGGVLLVTLPTMSRVDCRAGVEDDCWRWTKAGAKYIFSPVFDNRNLEIKAYGNVYTGLMFWIGGGIKEISNKKFKYNDPNFPVLITVKATKND